MNLSPENWPRDIFVCIPAYQSSSSLAGLLPELLNAVPAAHVCVVDDGSTDATGELCSRTGINHARHAENRGKGAALATGFTILLEKGAEAVITMDADGQHAVADLGLFVEEFRRHPETGICIGRRKFAKSGMPLSRIVSNALTSRILSLLCGVPVPDSQCGYRLYSARLLRGITITCTRYTMESEVILKAARLGFPVRSVPVQTLYLRGQSHISHLTDTLRWIRAVLGIWIRLRLYGISEPRRGP
ncbi:MAG: glycosyltransferase family 2 protein [Chitinispirillaceae bacterium]|nr:glycosyltransferase family 2 protein [Chitinispirillaceae bacterium]